MISPCNHEPGLWHFRRKQVERLNHEFEAFVRSPFAECQDAMRWRAAAREIGKLRPPGQ